MLFILIIMGTAGLAWIFPSYFHSKLAILIGIEIVLYYWVLPEFLRMKDPTEKLAFQTIIPSQFKFENDVVIFSIDKRELKISSDSIYYKKKRIYLKDLEGVCFHLLTNTINGADTKYYYMAFEDSKQRIDVSLTSHLFFGAKKKGAVFLELFNFSRRFLFPIVISNLRRKIFETKETVIIGGLLINYLGLSYKRFLIGPHRFISWDDITEAKVEGGRVKIYAGNTVQSWFECDIIPNVANVFMLDILDGLAV